MHANGGSFRIFLSSTQADLVAEREAVELAVHRMGDSFDGMEYFGSSPNAPLPECLRRVAECDFVLPLLGRRYGSKPPDRDKSFTELEFEEAEKREKPILAYYIDEKAYGPKEEWDSEVIAFRSRLRDIKIHSCFTSPEDLATKVAADLGREIRSEVLRLEWDSGIRATQHSRVIEKMRHKDFQSAKDENRELLVRYPRSPRANYNQACILTRLASSATDQVSQDLLLTSAVDYLERALEYGIVEYIDRYSHRGKRAHNQILQDPDLGLLLTTRPDLFRRVKRFRRPSPGASCGC